MPHGEHIDYALCLGCLGELSCFCKPSQCVCLWFFSRFWARRMAHVGHFEFTYFSEAVAGSTMLEATGAFVKTSFRAHVIRRRRARNLHIKNSGSDEQIKCSVKMFDRSPLQPMLSIPINSHQCNLCREDGCMDAPTPKIATVLTHANGS